MRKRLLIISAATLGLLGTVVVAQTVAPMADKTVTRTEAEAKAKEHFAMMDVNKDGKLDMADREARQADHFKMLDTDGNGAISQTEFNAAHQGKGDGRAPMAGGPGMRNDGAGMGRAMRHGGMGGGKRGGSMMLQMVDANKDGAISRDEFVAAHLKHFDMADTNKDGSVTPEERKAARQKMREQMRGMMGGMREGVPPPPPPK